MDYPGEELDVRKHSMEQPIKNLGDGNQETQGRKWPLIVAALWLDAIVIMFVVSQLNRIPTPMVQWANRIAELVLGR
jgi:hypothetical protein